MRDGTSTYNPFGGEAGSEEGDGERAEHTMPVPRIFGISLRGALIVTTGRHSQLLCLLSWRGCADSKREVDDGRKVGGGCPE